VSKSVSFALYVLKIDHAQHDYFPVLIELKLSSLADRRVAANLSFLNKLLDGSIDAPTLLFNINFRVPHRCLRHHTPFFSVPNCTTNYGRNNPILYVIMHLANEQPTFLS